MGSGLDAILKHSHIGLFSPLTGAILNPNAVSRCEFNDKGGNRIPICKFPLMPSGYVTLFPPMLRPMLLKIDLLHLEAFCLAHFEINTPVFLAARRDQ